VAWDRIILHVVNDKASLNEVIDRPASGSPVDFPADATSAPVPPPQPETRTKTRTKTKIAMAAAERNLTGRTELLAPPGPIAVQSYVHYPRE